MNNDHTFVESKTYRRLSFDLTLEPNEEVEIAYSIPYTYGDLIRDIRYYRY